MRIALAAAKFINGDIPHNLAQIRRFAGQAKAAGAGLVCFGEAFLQGFDAFVWEHEKDRDMALCVTQPPFTALYDISVEWDIDLMTGFLEREGERLYSSCALIVEGKLRRCFRRLSRGWKEFSKTSHHYREGDEAPVFSYQGRRCQMALCGDVWDMPERFTGADLLFWPVYINFTPEEWGGLEQAEYAHQMKDLAPDVLMINSLSDDPDAHGGCSWFSEGKTKASLAMGSEGLLVLDI